MLLDLLDVARTLTRGQESVPFFFLTQNAAIRFCQASLSLIKLKLSRQRAETRSEKSRRTLSYKYNYVNDIFINPS